MKQGYLILFYAEKLGQKNQVISTLRRDLANASSNFSNIQVVK